MNQCDFNKIAEKYVNEYTRIKDSAFEFEPHGIFHSEMLMVLVAMKELGISKVIESGRARGQSTEIIARIAKRENIDFHSVELKRNEHSDIAEQRLNPLKEHVTLHYGNSFDVIPKLLDHQKTLILIDGPKGLLAQKLGASLLRQNSVIAIMYHDSARDKVDFRNIVEKFFPGNFITSDDYEYVKKYRFLDDECWRVASERSGVKNIKKPYYRGKKRMRSYGPTLLLLLREGIDNQDVLGYGYEVERLIKWRKSFLGKMHRKINNFMDSRK